MGNKALLVIVLIILIGVFAFVFSNQPKATATEHTVSSVTGTLSSINKEIRSE